MFKKDILEWKVNGEIVRIPCFVSNDSYVVTPPRKIDIMDFAHGIVYISNSIGITITNLKLQKLLSEIQTFYKRNSIEIFDDKPSLWRHGLVYTEVYDYYKSYFNDHIGYYDEYYINKLNDEDLIIIQDLIVDYKNLEPWDMVKNNLEKIKVGYFDLITEKEN